MYSLFFFFNDTATTEIYTLSLHDALPISPYTLASKKVVIGSSLSPKPSRKHSRRKLRCLWRPSLDLPASKRNRDRKSTRLNSSHSQISYAVFCLKKKKIPR